MTGQWRSGRDMRLDLLPERATWGGYIYVIAFTDAKATVKVGSTSDPRSRFLSHLGAGEPFGISIGEWCLSPEHARHLETERLLIQAAEQLGGQKSRREYFTDVTFADVVAQAQRISLPGREQDAGRQAAESRRRTGHHEAEQRISADAANRLMAPDYGMTEAQFALFIEREPETSEAFRAHKDLVECARMSRRNAFRGRAVPA